LQVITNHYKTKNLSLLSNRIHSIETVAPDAISQALDELMHRPVMFKSEFFPDDHVWQNYLEGNAEFSEMRIPILKSIFKV
jgi:hypothetical protein